MPISPAPQEHELEYRRPLIDRIPTVHGLGRGALIMAGLGVYLATVAKDSVLAAAGKAKKAIDDLGDAYMEYEYSENSENSQNNINE